MGWIGKADDLEEILESAGADKDKAGRYLIYNEMPASFLGMGDELVVSDKSSYSINHKQYNLAHLLNSSDIGIKVNVL